MFDLGFSELILIAVVTLIVVGPERLPKVARTAGHLLGRLQRYVSDVKSDIQREMQLEELKKLQQQVEQQARELETSMRGQVQSVEADLAQTAAEAKSSLDGQSGAAASSAAPVTEAVPVAVPAEGTALPEAQPGEPAVDSRQMELGLAPAAVPLANTTTTTDKA
ncbi:Sec-independent protein translocase protein TatB [Aromatoleum petrolei]|uniref:Sec-independent protein translocase protein TatB n=1 Tax=Aromatoleum petrolei TaxID=76116 RepID=A0ABX1MXI7_9RHOO|nr:Sec-independent protein translocase protein TatB [Aromatoleum petrolei]NMF89772.1 twin-arginine translocase subunit TatB [Aromatoleum petrolei]QTQ37415.1 Sec-independent protein translocase protein [Aromatoleum petrolei]